MKKMNVLNLLTSILSKEIQNMWSTLPIEEDLINLIGDVGFTFLQNPQVKLNPTLVTNIFHLFGSLIEKYNFSNQFKSKSVRVLQTKENSHLTIIFAQGMQFLSEKYNCKQLIPEFIQNLTEWQSNDYVHDTIASKNWSQVLVNMTSLMPDVMLNEIINLIRFLNHESCSLRICVLNILVDVVINILNKGDLEEKQKNARDLFLQQLYIHILDTSASVRSKVLNLWCRIQNENALPVVEIAYVLNTACGRIKDKVTHVRRNALILLTKFIQTNPFSSMVSLNYF